MPSPNGMAEASVSFLYFYILNFDTGKTCLCLTDYMKSITFEFAIRGIHLATWKQMASHPR
jgi:hypothetical protein